MTPDSEEITSRAFSSVEDVLALPPWDFYVVAASLLCGYVLVPMILSNALLLIDPFMESAQQFFVQQGVTLLTWLSIFISLQWRYGGLGLYFGLRLTRPLGYYAWQTILLIIVSGGLTLGLALFWKLLASFDPSLRLSNTVPYSDYGPSQFWVLAFFAVIMAPLLEELIFRGLVQSTFHKVCGRAGAIFWAGLVFMGMHANYFNDIKALAHVMVLGLSFGWWRERTQSLIPGIFAHWFNNGLATVILFQQLKPPH